MWSSEQLFGFSGDVITSMFLRLRGLIKADTDLIVGVYYGKKVAYTFNDTSYFLSDIDKQVHMLCDQGSAYRP